jgi:hypothetical protein
MKTKTVIMFAGRMCAEKPNSTAAATAFVEEGCEPVPNSNSATMTKSAVDAGSENSHPEYTNNGVENATIKLHAIAER